MSNVIHIHSEHGLHPRHSRHYQLELQRTTDPFNAKLDKNPVPEVLAYISVHATTKENASTMDDGDSRDIKENTSWSPT
jgi:hypothetical protein